MARWEPGARERLMHAALECFAARGFDGTTVAEIAAAAGLTERTFFRHFADKREVIFSGQEQFEQAFLDGLAGAEGTDPVTLVAAALDGAAGFFPDDRRTWSRARQVVIDAEPVLLERERHKLSTLAATLTHALIARGVDPTAATLAAESGVTVFRVAFGCWNAVGEDRPLVTIQHAVLDDLRRLLTPSD